MKRFLSLLTVIFVVSCNKNNPDPGQQKSGLIEGYLKDTPALTVQKTTESQIGYRDGVPTDRGYHFKPLKDIKITYIGGRIAETGIFKIKISNIDNGWSKADGWIDVLIDSINITNTTVFQYKLVDKDVILAADHNYLISYFNESHNSVYDAGTGYMPGYLQLPLTIQDIEIERIYYSYYQIIIGGYQLSEEAFTNGLGIFRGLVDLKYELVE
jgi:hypothetical protein